MSGIHVVVFLVKCTQSLLLCDDIETSTHIFRDMGDCQARLESVIQVAQTSAGGNFVVMGRCRYLLQRPEPAGAARQQLH